MMLSQPRVMLAMARDGLVPPSFFGAVHPNVPHAVEVDDPDRRRSSRMLGGLLPLRILAELVNIGTLLAFVIVCARGARHAADAPGRASGRSACPLVPFVPILGILTCLLLMFSLPGRELVAADHLAGDRPVVYFAYGRHHSALRKAQGTLPEGLDGRQLASRSAHSG